MTEIPLAIALIVGFSAFWVLLMTVIGRFGGWGQLADVYAARDDFNGNLRRFQSLRFRGRGKYSGCVSVGTSARGLYLSTIFPFHIGHPPLFIPWEDVTMSRTTYFLFPFVELRCRRVPERPLLVHTRLGEHLASEAGISLPQGTEAGKRMGGPSA